MTGIQTLETDAVPISQAGIPAPLPKVLRASAAQAWQDLPLLSAIPRAVELDVARKHYGNAYKNFDQAGATDWMKGKGLEGEFTFEDRQYNELELNILARRKREEIARQQVLSRAEPGIASGAARLGVALGVSVLDPLNVASAFVPVVGEARYAQAIARAGGAFGRAAVRAGVGAAEGAVGAALVEPIIYGANVQQQADYSLQDSMLNIAFGTVFGGGLHVGAGALVDRSISKRITEFQRSVDAVTEKSVPVAGEAPILRADQVPDPYFDRATALSREMRKSPDLNVEDPAAVSRFIGAKAESLSQFVKSTGGIADDGGELAARDITNKALPGLVRREVTKMSSMDAVRERVFDHGYFPTKADYNDISDSELLDAITDDLTGSRRYTGQVEDALAPIRDAKHHFDTITQHGIDPEMSVDEIATRLRAIDDEARVADSEVPDDATLHEYDSASARAERLPADQRAAVLKSAIAQGAQEQNVHVDGMMRGDLGQVREDARAAQDPDQGPLADPESVRLADEELAEQGDEMAQAEQQLADATETLKDAQRTLDDPETMPAEVRAELEAAEEFASDANDYAATARLMVQCALRHAA